MKNKRINRLNLILLLNVCLSLFAVGASDVSKGACEVDITQKGATCEIINNDQVFYTGVVKMPKCKNSDIELCMCYNGDIMKIKRNDNLYMFKDAKKNKINLLMTSSENFSVDAQDNTVLYFRLEKQHSYKFFKLLRKLKSTSDSQRKYIWEITESDLPQKEDKVVVPLDTLIIPIDPSKIDLSFEQMTSKEGSKVINLPTIEIEGQGFCDLEEQINKCCLAFMNIKPFHAKQSKREVRQDNLKVCMVN